MFKYFDKILHSNDKVFDNEMAVLKSLLDECISVDEINDKLSGTECKYPGIDNMHEFFMEFKEEYFDRYGLL
jgi:hypothetical protein